MTNEAADIVELCNAADQPTMAATLIRDGVSLVEARTRIDHAGAIRAIVALACRSNPTMTIDADYADRMVAARAPIAQVRAALIDAAADADEAIVLDAHRRTGDGRQNDRQVAKANMQALVAQKYGKTTK